MDQHDGSTSDVPARLAIVTGRLNRKLRGSSGGLSHGLLSALAALNYHGAMRLAELAHLESISAPSTTRLIGELERMGLVSRVTDELDHRAVLVSITELGEQTVVRARTSRASVILEMFEKLTPEEKAAIAAAVPALEKAVGHGV
jgi:DNA-binding MarR family transcriptional regulator